MQDKDKPLLKSLYEAIADMQNPVKDTSGYGYKYATLDQVVGIIRPALRAHGCDFYQKMRVREQHMVLETVVFNEDTSLTLDERIVQYNGDAQKFGSFETYMRRYALMTVFGLAGEDDDGQRTKPAQNDLVSLDTKLKKTLVAYFNGDKDAAFKKYNELMEPKGAQQSMAYIKQQIEKFS